MTKFIRYALASVCFAASVGCLALWWRSTTQHEMFNGPSFVLPNQALGFAASSGLGTAQLFPSRLLEGRPWRRFTVDVKDGERAARERATVERFVAEHGYFGAKGYDDYGAAIHFPLWYPTLIFALAGVAALRFRRQFSIRTALICVSVVAALLGMVATL